MAAQYLTNFCKRLVRFSVTGKMRIVGKLPPPLTTADLARRVQKQLVLVIASLSNLDAIMALDHPDYVAAMGMLYLASRDNCATHLHAGILSATRWTQAVMPLQHNFPCSN